MADFPASLADIDPSELSKADLIIYGCKFLWDKKDDQIHLLGLQAGTSTTSTLSSSAINLKAGSVHAPGQHAETFVVDSYWRTKDNYVARSIRRCVREKRLIEGDSQEGVTLQKELDPELYEVGLKLYSYAHNTDIGGTMDPEPDPLDEYLQSHGQSTQPTQPTAPQNK